jgi:hypothetical protein
MRCRPESVVGAGEHAIRVTTFCDANDNYA